MKIYLIYIGCFLFFLTVAGFTASYKKQTQFTYLLFFWMIFCVFIGILELVLLSHIKYISLLPPTADPEPASANVHALAPMPNYWLRDVSLPQVFHPHFWAEAWREYGDYCDPRYTEDTNLVHYMELFLALSSFIYIYIIYQLMTPIKKKKQLLLVGILMVSIPATHFIGTLIYFGTLHKYLNNKPIKKTAKFWGYLSLNGLWLVVPILMIIRGRQIIQRNV